MLAQSRALDAADRIKYGDNGWDPLLEAHLEYDHPDHFAGLEAVLNRVVVPEISGTAEDEANKLLATDLKEIKVTHDGTRHTPFANVTKDIVQKIINGDYTKADDLKSALSYDREI